MKANIPKSTKNKILAIGSLVAIIISAIAIVTAISKPKYKEDNSKYAASGGGEVCTNATLKTKDVSQKLKPPVPPKRCVQWNVDEIAEKYFKERENIQRKVDKDMSFFSNTGSSARTFDDMVLYTKKIATLDGWSDQKLNDELEIIALKRKNTDLTTSIGYKMALRIANERKLDAVNDALEELTDSINDEPSKQIQTIRTNLAAEKETATRNLRTLRNEEDALKKENDVVTEKLDRMKNKTKQQENPAPPINPFDVQTQNN